MKKTKSDQTDVDCEILPTTDGNVTQAGSGNYDAVRYNAMTHGILSKLVVLPHEDVDQFIKLRDALIEEHRPSGVTEQHLVEELATIIWRKRRVLLAEASKINESLKNVVNSPDSVISSAIPLQRGLSAKYVDLPELISESTDELTVRQQDAELDLAATRKAAQILKKGGAHAYEKARRALIPESRNWWDEFVEDEEYPATAEGLAEFIEGKLEPVCISMINEAKHQPAIKAQTFGKSLQPQQFETLNRYETHLDRKFERTLAMILKLKEIRVR